MIIYYSKTKSTKSSIGAPNDTEKEKRQLYIATVIDFVYLFVRLALLVTVLTVCLQRRIKDSLIGSPAYSRLMENIALWSEDIILDFKIVNTYNCPDGYDSYSGAAWSGNQYGCACSSKVGLWEYTVVLPGQCQVNQLKLGYIKVLANDAIPFYFWRGNQHLCVKRLTNYTFYSSYENIINATSYHKCAANTGYEIDVSTYIPCPITALSATHSLSNILSLSAQRYSNYPIASFRLSEYLFCDDYNITNISPERYSNYILENIEASSCSTPDPRTVLLDSISELDLFTNNPDIMAIVQTLPTYPLPDDSYNYSLGYVRYPPWTYTCRVSYHYDLVDATQRFKLYQIPDVGRYVALVFSFVSVLFVLYYTVSKIMELMHKYRNGILYLTNHDIAKLYPQWSYRKDRQTELIKFGVMYALCCGAIIAFVVYYYGLLDHYLWFYIAQACTEYPTVSWMMQYQQRFWAVMEVILLAIVLIVFVIVLDIVYLFKRLWKGDLESAELEHNYEDQVTNEEYIGEELVYMDKRRVYETEENLNLDDGQSIGSDLFVYNQFVFHEPGKAPKVPVLMEHLSEYISNSYDSD